MFLVRPPGVYRVDTDTSLLLDVLREGGYADGRRVLDIGTGTGALALAAARAGAASVTAVDLSLRSVAAAWLNSRLHRVACIVRCGDLFGPVAGQYFDLILAFRSHSGQPALCSCGDEHTAPAPDQPLLGRGPGRTCRAGSGLH
jgi:release factor glutamine methyltransferase